MSRVAFSVVFVLSLVLGLACAGQGGGPSRCPHEGWCGPAGEAERMAEDAAGSTLTCPIHVESAYALRPAAIEGQEAATAGSLPAGVPAGAHGTLDEKRTRKLRADGDVSTCCYTWVEPCPSGA
jgi:hypothetical protein